MVINDKVVLFLLFFENLCTLLREIHTHAHNEDKFIFHFDILTVKIRFIQNDLFHLLICIWFIMVREKITYIIIAHLLLIYAQCRHRYQHRMATVCLMLKHNCQAILMLTYSLYLILSSFFPINIADFKSYIPSYI